ncbi:rab GTPase-activating protein 1-like isoform X4 [Mizuhopecten yessoensis]|uniref:rab GTPase-activating protein 1-like isoform X4 n=1 Tax=Mizuhopecten yessoensis TaxID=6573 RepID=UPI000B45E1C8|nr:rab GTPase-activating protein 1-like isoform X4 [Mizuhopecten yessoensis]
MEDAVSRSSLESSSTGDDYVVVNGEPKLKITGDINDLNMEISVDSPPDQMTSTLTSSESLSTDIRLGESNKGDHVLPSSQSADVISAPAGEFARERSTSLPASPFQGETVFNGVTYLGCALVNAPRSEVEIYRNMAILNDQSQMAIPIILSVPSTSHGVVRPDGCVRILDPSTNTDITSYKIHRILFCARGPADSDERLCFAFTCSHGDSAESAIFQCHVFRCELAEAVAKILYSFATTFRRVPKNTRLLSSTSIIETEQTAIFTVSLEIKEDDGKGNYSYCPKDKNMFKLRCNSEKNIMISVSQTGTRELKIERCFGLLISPGRNVKHGDMHLIEMNSMGYTGDGKSYSISGNWDPTEKCFAVLNTETPKDTRVFLTIAVDLVIHGIQEPVRFAMETKAKIFPQTERFWYFTRKPYQEQFHVKLRPSELESPDADIQMLDVVGVQSQTEIDRKKAGMSLQGLNTSRQIPDDIQTPQEPDEESDGDEPLLSGSGVVSKEVTDENLLDAWHETLTKWHQNLAQRPKQVHHLVRKGIPEALRGEVWQLLAGCHDNSELLEAYRVLITKESPNESVIQRDINRTFPAHDFFKETGGLGQDSLYRISKAYSVYDEEIGYVQGLSFLAASLLLHMPEEQAFAVLVKTCFEYGLRDFFKQGFEELHLKFYQLDRLMEDQLADLHDHFMEMNLETHMFASQWFLTLFTAKFPLYMVFHILDLYLCEGREMMFNVALALLKNSRKDLLALDFEGILKYFRVHLPKKYRTEESAKDLMQMVISIKVSSRKLKKYEKEYMAMKEQEMQQEDPVERFERESKRLLEANMRLEQENDDLAHELVESKLALRSELDQYQDQCEELTTDLAVTKKLLTDTQEEKQRLEHEATQVKEMCRRELDRVEAENGRNSAIIADYKQICSQLSERLEKQQTANREELSRIMSQVKGCDQCSKMFASDGKVQLPEPKLDPDSVNPKIVDLHRQIRELELELAQTKLALVESECKTQDLTHQLNSAVTEIQASKNTWFQKTINSIKVATNPGSTKKDQKE